MTGADKFNEYCEELLNGKWSKVNPRTRLVKIKVVGCWDTVGSVGVPDYWWSKGIRQAFEFYDTSLCSGQFCCVSLLIREAHLVVH